MAIIYSYPTATPASGDLIVGTDITGKVTKNFTVGSIVTAGIPNHITGTANTVPIFTASNTIGNSIITQNAGGNAATVAGTVTATDVLGSKFISTTNSAFFIEPSLRSYFNFISADSIIGSTINVGVSGWQFEYSELHSGSVTFRFDNDHYRIYSGSGAGEIARFTDTGNVGIATTNPQFRLDVGSSMRVQTSNNLYFGGTGSTTEWSINSNNASKDLTITNTTSTGVVRFNNSRGVVLYNVSTTGINAIPNPVTGAMVYNTTLNTICFYNGTAWQKVSHTAM
tara:strand:- start:2659 stop:3507 length:849 start_codon:yes stop_codon:yes gene_type:complete